MLQNVKMTLRIFRFTLHLGKRQLRGRRAAVAERLQSQPNEGGDNDEREERATEESIH